MSVPTVVSLFSGAGGMDYGLEAAGFSTAVCLDLEHDACETIRRNRRWHVIEDDVFDVSTRELLGRGGVVPGDLALVMAGPPCQPFSKSGYWASGDALRLKDPRSATLVAFLRIIEEALPQALLFENVRGFAFNGKSEGLAFLLEGLRDINHRTGANYQPAATILQAADFGVPQLRERFILAAHRDGREFSFPRPTESRTAWDAIGDVRPGAHEELSIRGRWAELLASIPEGENYLWHTERGGGLPLFGWRRRFWNFLLKLAKDLPSWTIQAQPGPAVGPFHWDNRRLAAREICRLQTFPDDVEIYGDARSTHKQVGNAVPSLLAETLGRSLGEQFFGMSYLYAPRLMPPRRQPVPLPSVPSPVPERFFALIGNHAAHPGTGQGYAALQRQEALL